MTKKDKPREKSIPSVHDQKKIFLLILGSIASIMVFGCIIFILAGRLDYAQGWILLTICFLILLISAFFFRKKKDLIKERRTPGPGVKKWDNIIIILYQIFLYGLITIAVLDSGRFHWSPPFPFWIYLLSALLLLSFSALSFWAMFSNNFFSSKVRIQKDRNHRVITSGPYRFIRHPGYSGIIFMIFNLALILGSLWALIPAGIIAILFIIRTAREDDTLKKELNGYQEYAKNVRFRLIPRIW